MRARIMLLVLAVAVSVRAWGGDALDYEKMAAEAEKACQASASTRPTPAMIKAKVEEAARLIEAQGEAAFPRFRGKDSPFIFAGTYVWVHDLNGKMLVHPIKYKMEGKALLGLKDSRGKAIFVEMNALVEQKGEGWIDYWWPKPGEKEGSRKVSYIKLVKKGETNDRKWVVGCGVYDLPEDEVAALLKP